MIATFLEYLQLHMNTIRLVIVGQGLLLIVLILSGPYSKRSSARLISAFIAIQSNHMLYWVLGITNLYYSAFTYAAFFLLGPLFYFYCLILVTGSFTFRWSMAGHVSPTFIVALWFILLSKFDAKGYYIPNYYVVLAFLFSLTIYAAMALRKLSHYQRNIHNLYSRLDDISLSWLQRIAATVLITSVILFTAMAIRMATGWIQDGTAILMRLWSIIQFYLIAVAGLRSQLQLFGYTAENIRAKHDTEKLKDVETFQSMQDSDLPMDGNAGKYRTSKLGDEEIEDIWQGVNDVMLKKELFLDNDLQLPQLAEALSIPRHEVSQVINSVTGQSFYDFVNRYRAEKAKSLIETNAHSNKAMIDIALDAGFSNAVTFGKYFKKLYSTTPAKYKKKLIESSRENQV